MLITCVPFTTIVVGNFGHLAPAIWLYAGHTLLIAAVGFRLVAITPHLEQGEHLRPPAVVSAAADRDLGCWRSSLSFVYPRRALWALTLNFVAPMIRRWTQRAAVVGLNHWTRFADYDKRGSRASSRAWTSGTMREKLT